MTEKDKMLAGKLYDANYNEELLNERTAAKELCHDFNRLRPGQTDERLAVLRRLLGRIGANCIIEPAFYCDYGYNIEIGDNLAANHNLVILDGAPVTIGNHVFIGPNCAFYTAGHPLDHERRNAGLEYAYPITVGDNVWFGGNVCVLPGVSIGDGAVIGAGSVVTKDVPACVLAVGNPCRVVRPIGEAERNRQIYSR